VSPRADSLAAGFVCISVPVQPIPPPPPGHKWKGIIHNNKVTWLAFWKDNVNGDFKYIWLAPSSRFKGESDVRKYTKAQKLKNYIEEIRKNYKKEMRSEHSQFRQRATAIYLIDFLALRVGSVAFCGVELTGLLLHAYPAVSVSSSHSRLRLYSVSLYCSNEKDTSEKADTVGCCSLRVEHLTFHDNNVVEFDFLGKDSMRYHQEIALDEHAVKNLKSFTSGKKSKDEVFSDLNTSLLNEHLKSLMPDLTAKVFRTYNASVTLEKELYKEGVDIDASEVLADKKTFYNNANRTVAILCNHQRSIPKGHDSAIAKMRDHLAALEEDRDEIEDWIEEAEGGKQQTKVKRKERASQREKSRKERLERARAEAKAKKEKEKADVRCTAIEQTDES
jgi:DNA topoisomerase-1